MMAVFVRSIWSVNPILDEYNRVMQVAVELTASCSGQHYQSFSKYASIQSP
jgi:hypothetical protein